jgi:hypothetical protein
MRSKSGEAARQGMVEAGMPECAAGQVVKVFGMLRDGVAEQVTNTVEQVTNTVEALTGRARRSFAAFARDHVHAFQTTEVGATA